MYCDKRVPRHFNWRFDSFGTELHSKLTIDLTIRMSSIAGCIYKNIIYTSLFPPPPKSQYFLRSVFNASFQISFSSLNNGIFNILHGAYIRMIYVLPLLFCYMLVF